MRQTITQIVQHLSNEAATDKAPQENQNVKLLLNNLTKNYGYWPKQEAEHG